MKTNKIKKQLVLKKATVARLNIDDMENVLGGKDTWVAACPGGTTLLPTSCDQSKVNCTRNDTCYNLYDPFYTFDLECID